MACQLCNILNYAVSVVSDKYQWSFRKTGTMGTLASQAEIAWRRLVQAAGTLLQGSGGITPDKNLEDTRKILQSSAF